MNLPLLQRDGDAVVLAYLQQIIEPVISQFKPECTVVSLGYDALDVTFERCQELGVSSIIAPGCDCCLSPQVFGHIVRSMMQLCPKVVLHSEGGYEPKQCGEAAVSCVRALCGEDLAPPRSLPEAPRNLRDRLHNFRKTFSRFGWKFPRFSWPSS